MDLACYSGETSWRYSSIARQADRGETLDAAEFARRFLHFEADAKQAEILLSTSKRGILNCSRQWGKSTVAAVKAVHRAYTQPESVVLIAGPVLRQSGEMLKKVQKIAALLGVPKRGDGINPISLAFPNGSRIIALPGNEDTARGYSKASLLVVDEAARAANDLILSLLPSLATSDGDLWLLSTPRGRKGFFYEAWEHGGSEWHRVSVPATECPRIKSSFLESQRRMMTRAWFEQEYLCQFTDNGTEVFGRQMVERALDSSLKPLRF